MSPIKRTEVDRPIACDRLSYTQLGCLLNLNDLIHIDLLKRINDSLLQQRIDMLPNSLLMDFALVRQCNTLSNFHALIKVTRVQVMILTIDHAAKAMCFSILDLTLEYALQVQFFWVTNPYVIVGLVLNNSTNTIKVLSDLLMFYKLVHFAKRIIYIVLAVLTR